MARSGQREMAGSDTLLKDEEYVGLQDEVRRQRQLLTYADGVLERKRHDFEAGLKMLDLMLACSRTSGLTLGEELFSQVQRFIDSALLGDVPGEYQVTPAAGTASAAPEQGAGGQPASSVLEVLRTYFQYHKTMTQDALQKLAGANGFTEESIKEELPRPFPEVQDRLLRKRHFRPG